VAYEWDYTKKRTKVIPRTRIPIVNYLLELFGIGPEIQTTGGSNPALLNRPLNKDKSHLISQKLDSLDSVFVDASRETGTPVEWLKATAMQESGGNADIQPKRNSADRGIMQIRNPVWDYYRTKGRLKFGHKEQSNPIAGIYVAARYFADMRKRNPKWTADQIISGYNRGETDVNADIRRAAQRNSKYDAGKTEYVREWNQKYNTVDSLEKSRRLPPR